MNAGSCRRAATLSQMNVANFCTRTWPGNYGRSTFFVHMNLLTTRFTFTSHRRWCLGLNLHCNALPSAAPASFADISILVLFSPTNKYPSLQLYDSPTVEEAAQVVCFEAAFALFVSLVLLQCHVSGTVTRNSPFLKKNTKTRFFGTESPIYRA